VGQKGDTFVRIVETKKQKDIKGPYTTLSHNWGPWIRTTLNPVNKENLLREGVALDELCYNFRQAIAVTQLLGIEYIWIDSLCIVQGPDGDFNVEGDLMHKVYRFSFCNIAATDSDETGFFHERKALQVLPARYTPSPESALYKRGTWRLVPEDMWDSELLGSFIYTRGWVFQGKLDTNT
jgi:hypothetical protein